MKEMSSVRTNKENTIINLLGITVLALLMLVGIVGATPFAYITNYGSDTVSVIDTTTNTVTATVPVGAHPYGVAASPDGTKVYVANSGHDDVSVIDTATNTVTATVPVGDRPRSFGQFIGPQSTGSPPSGASQTINQIKIGNQDQYAAAYGSGSVASNIIIEPQIGADSIFNIDIVSNSDEGGKKVTAKNGWDKIGSDTATSPVNTLTLSNEQAYQTGHRSERSE